MANEYKFTPSQFAVAEAAVTEAYRRKTGITADGIRNRLLECPYLTKDLHRTIAAYAVPHLPNNDELTFRTFCGILAECSNDEKEIVLASIRHLEKVWEYKQYKLVYWDPFLAKIRTAGISHTFEFPCRGDHCEGALHLLHGPHSVLILDALIEYISQMDHLWSFPVDDCGDLDVDQTVKHLFETNWKEADRVCKIEERKQWKEAKHNGKTYWYHDSTRVSTWNKPDEKAADHEPPFAGSLLMPLSIMFMLFNNDLSYRFIIWLSDTRFGGAPIPTLLYSEKMSNMRLFLRRSKQNRSYHHFRKQLHKYKPRALRKRPTDQ